MSILIERAGSDKKAAFFHKNKWKIARLLGGAASDEASETKPKPKRRRKTSSKAKTTAKKTTAKKTTAKAKPKAKSTSKKSSSKAKSKSTAKQKETPVEKNPVNNTEEKEVKADVSTSENNATDTDQ